MRARADPGQPGPSHRQIVNYSGPRAPLESEHLRQLESTAELTSSRSRPAAPAEPLRAALPRRPRGFPLGHAHRIASVSGEPSLFGQQGLSAGTQVGSGGEPIDDWRVDQLRRALDARGLITMADRQRAVEDAVGRQVDSLRSLTRKEATRVIAEFDPPPPPPPPRSTASASRRPAPGGSAWDDREEATWIDKL